MTNIIGKIEIYRKGFNVERIHTMRHLIPYSNGHHSANASLIAHELCKRADLDSRACILYTLMHDLAEAYTGDIPAYVKVEAPVIRDHLEAIESRWNSYHLPDMPDLHWKEQDICKVADLVELGMHCIEEYRMGNSTMLSIVNTVIKYLQPYKDNIEGTSEFIDYFVSRGEIKQ